MFCILNGIEGMCYKLFWCFLIFIFKFAAVCRKYFLIYLGINWFFCVIFFLLSICVKLMWCVVNVFIVVFFIFLIVFLFGIVFILVKMLVIVLWFDIVLSIRFFKFIFGSIFLIILNIWLELRWVFIVLSFWKSFWRIWFFFVLFDIKL